MAVHLTGRVGGFNFNQSFYLKYYQWKGFITAFCLYGQSPLSVSNAQYDQARRYGIGGNVISESFSYKMKGGP